MKKSRIVGALLCIISVMVAVLHVFYGYLVPGGPRISLAFALPVTVILFVVIILGFWLGWIMLTTKEAKSPPTPPTEEPEEAEEETDEENSEEDE